MTTAEMQERIKTLEAENKALTKKYNSAITQLHTLKNQVRLMINKLSNVINKK